MGIFNKTTPPSVDDIVTSFQTTLEQLNAAISFNGTKIAAEEAAIDAAHERADAATAELMRAERIRNKIADLID